jgi:hypothetical protein
MDVKELRSLLKDSEGNGYSPLSGGDKDCVYLPDSTWSGDVLSMQWTADEACYTEEDWEELKKQKRSLVLHPVN